MTPERLKRVLLSLPDIGYRTGWLRSELEQLPVSEAARLLNALGEENERSELTAREAMLSVAMVLAAQGEGSFVEALRSEAAAQRLLSLDRLVRHPPHDAGPERADDPPVPDYGVGRELTLGERRSLARLPHRRHFDRLLRDPHPMVIRLLLGNPKLTEDDVVRLATRRPLRLGTLREIVASARWLTRARVRMAILLNPGSPATTSFPLLGLCTRAELRQIVDTTSAPGLLRATALELLERRPPLGEPDPSELILQ